MEQNVVSFVQSLILSLLTSNVALLVIHGSAVFSLLTILHPAFALLEGFKSVHSKNNFC